MFQIWAGSRPAKVAGEATDRNLIQRLGGMPRVTAQASTILLLEDG